MKKICLVFLTLLMAGCSSTNSSKITYEMSPKGIPDDQTAIIYFLRQKVNPSLGNPNILINDKKVGVLPNNSFFWVKTLPGNKIISTEWSWDTGSDNDTTQVDIKAGEIYYLLLKQTGQVIVYPVYNSIFSSKLFLIDKNEAEEFFGNLKYF